MNSPTTRIASSQPTQPLRKKSQNLKKQLEQWDHWIREGQSQKVKDLCRQLNHKKIPRSLLANYVQIARRVGLYELMVLWLNPIVRSEKILDKVATAEELALYASGLSRLGAFQEADRLLKSIDPQQESLVYFYQASLNINQWSYRKAIPLLKKFLFYRQRHLQRKNKFDYWSLVGRLNLCASLTIIERNQAAEREINKLMKLLDSSHAFLLKGNLLEIRAQWNFHQGRMKEALEDLAQAQRILMNSDVKSLIFVEKWKARINANETKNSPDIIAQYEAIKNQAIKIQDWETVRDCDFYIADYTKNPHLFLRVYWGSKFPDYKKRILRVYKNPTVITTQFIWIGGAMNLASSSLENPPAPAVSIDLVQQAPSRLLKLLFFALTREFYRPISSIELLTSVYADEYLKPDVSIIKFYRLMARARQWLKEMNVPLIIKSYKNKFKLEFTGPCQLILHSSLNLESRKQQPPPHNLLNLESFTSHDWAKNKKISVRTALREINIYIAQGRLRSKRTGRQRVYLWQATA